ncbi:hypothetical protein [Corynebacterium striatum]|uniref:hypothetical protein n=1 Tax=Corynebacterium striatum TaxID=43770 RepID=UPI002550D02C|nr:hypothetical protein [Corynebacterium striatum]MDK8832311.1 hypothetical protein [Corynebacterium striatum]
MTAPATIADAILSREFEPLKVGELSGISLPSEGPVNLEYVSLAARIVDTSGALDMLVDWDRIDNPQRYRGGRKAHVSKRSALILLVLLGLLGKPLYVSEAAEIVRYRLDGKAWQTIGFALDDFDDRHNLQWYFRMWRTIKHTIRRTIDPYPETKHHGRLTPQEYEALKASRDGALVGQRKARAAIFASAFALASARLVGDDVLTGSQGDMAVDGTIFPVTGYGAFGGQKRVPSTPDAGYYVREGNHSPADNPGKKKVFWGFEATFTVTSGGQFGATVPHLITGCSVDKPGHRIGQNVRQALAVYEAANLPRRYMSGDMAYSPGSAVDHYQRPMRAAGWKLLGDIPNKEAARGIQGEYEGVVFVDGQAYCPAIKAMPQLLDPRAALDAGDINAEQIERLVAQRETLRMRTKQINEDGSIRFACPALEGKVSCPARKNDSQAKKAAARRTLGGRVPLPLSVKQVPAGPQRGKVCSGKSVTVPLYLDRGGVDNINKHLHQGPAAYTQEWHDTYKRGRAAIEARNASAKHDVALGLGDRAKRGMRGFDGFAMLLTVLVAASNALRVIGYLKRGRDSELAPKPPRGGRPRKNRAEDNIIGVAWGNAPPAQDEAA